MVTNAELKALPRAPPKKPDPTPLQSCNTAAHSLPLIRRNLSLFVKSRSQSLDRTPRMRFAAPPNKSKRWKNKSTSDVRTDSGTILRAVPRSPGKDDPPTRTPPASAHSETKSASSDEIISSIRKNHPGAIEAMAAHSIPQYSPSSNAKLARRSSKKSRKTGSSDPIFGYWKDGLVQLHPESARPDRSQIQFVASASQAFLSTLTSSAATDAKLQRSVSNIDRSRHTPTELTASGDRDFAHARRTTSLRATRSAPRLIGAGLDLEPSSSVDVSPASSVGNNPFASQGPAASLVSPIVPPVQPIPPRRPFNRRAPTTLYECEDEDDYDSPLPTTNKALETGNSGASNHSHKTSTSSARGSPLLGDTTFFSDDSPATSVDATPEDDDYKPLPELRNSVTKMFSMDSPIDPIFLGPSKPRERSRSPAARDVAADPGRDSEEEDRPPTPPPKPQLIHIALELPWEDRSSSPSPATAGARSPRLNPNRVTKRKSTGRKGSGKHNSSHYRSPTLSDVEKELHEQLSTMSEKDNPFEWNNKAIPEGEDAAPAPLAPNNQKEQKPHRRSSSFEGRVAVSSTHIASQFLPIIPKNKRRSASASASVLDTPAETSVASPESQPEEKQVSTPSEEPHPQQQQQIAELPAEVNIAELPAEEIKASRRERMRNIMGRLIIPPSATNSIVTEVVDRPMSEAQRQALEGPSPEAAERVIVTIFESLENLDDLFNTATVNRGFYDVFKRHELTLVRDTLWKMSPPAWEHRESSGPQPDTDTPLDSALPLPDYTSATYLQAYRNDVETIRKLKSLILERCKLFLRPETREALESDDPADSFRVDDAFWRIWTFCKVFGSGRDREFDVIAQQDWLKGGMIAHQQDCTSTVMSRDSIELSDVLLMAPDSFGLGNAGGLSAESLYNITELWTCLGVLIQGFEGRTEQAREYGVYEVTGTRDDDVDGEEQMLEEWYYYLLTQGLEVIAELADDAASAEPTAFEKAKENGWIEWKPLPPGQSRATFLKDAVARVYEEKISGAHTINSSKRKQMREIVRERIKAHGDEIKLRKQEGDLRMIRMSMERPMSDWEGVMRTLDRDSIASMPTSPRSALEGSRRGSLINPSYASFARTHLRIPEEDETSSQEGGATSSTHSRKTSESDLSTVSETTPTHPAFRTGGQGVHRRISSAANRQHPFQQAINTESDPAENTADKAIFRIVEMGFTADQAKHALRVTDMGDGLRVDRAVELLLRSASA